MIKYRRTDFAFTQTEKGIVIIDHITGQIITLNESASSIWLLLGRPLTLSEIIEALQKKYSGVQPKEVEYALQKLIQQSIIRKLLSRKPAVP